MKFEELFECKMDLWHIGFIVLTLDSLYSGTSALQAAIAGATIW